MSSERSTRSQPLGSRQERLELFHRAGVFLPRLFVLSACHSGDILGVKDWSDFLAVAQGREPGDRETIDDDSGAGRQGRRVNLDRCPAAS
ncbi:MAG: hypothetical protein R3C99_19015 [Pirellulaceae bacterium]